MANVAFADRHLRDRFTQPTQCLQDRCALFRYQTVMVNRAAIHFAKQTTEARFIFAIRRLGLWRTAEAWR